MSDGSQFIDIILFAMVAVFLGLRLRSVLGRRTGNEPPPPEARFGGRPGTPANGAAVPDAVVDLAQRRQWPAAEPERLPPSNSLAGRLAQIGAIDRRFDPQSFAQGARMAFEMIVRAFAQGDEATLRPLLSDEVYENFSAAIRARQQAGETSQSEVQRVESAEIVEAHFDGRMARIDMRFVSYQLIVVKDATGAVVEGDPSRPVRLIDLWSFARDVRSTNPNWLLVATSSHDE